MSDENQENGTRNGQEVPEIELIIKREHLNFLDMMSKWDTLMTMLEEILVANQKGTVNLITEVDAAMVISVIQKTKK